MLFKLIKRRESDPSKAFIQYVGVKASVQGSM
jgi:hypothetical protein